jgi:hypothetical protein
MSKEPTLYRRARPEDVARLDQEQRERCAQCGAGCTQPLPSCAGKATLREIVSETVSKMAPMLSKALPTISMMLACGGIAWFAALCFQAAPK